MSERSLCSTHRIRKVDQGLNLHPFIVHFPLALLILSALSDTVGILGRREQALKMGYVLLLLGTLGAIGGALSGQSAAEAAAAIPGVGQDLDEHEDLGTAVVWVAIALTLTRTHLVHRKQFTGTTRVIYLLFALGVAGLVSASGYTGGHLVYKYGAGTQPVLDTLE